MGILLDAFPPFSVLFPLIIALSFPLRHLVPILLLLVLLLLFFLSFPRFMLPLIFLLRLGLRVVLVILVRVRVHIRPVLLLPW